MIQSDVKKIGVCSRSKGLPETYNRLVGFVENELHDISENYFGGYLVRSEVSSIERINGLLVIKCEVHMDIEHEEELKAITFTEKNPFN